LHTETVRATWIDSQDFLLRDRFGFPIFMSQPMGVNGADLLPLSLIGCTVWDVISILQKQRQQLTHFEVTAESEREDDPPWRFLKICIHYRISGKGLKAEQIRKAIDLTENKYCSIYATLRQTIELVSDFEIIEKSS
jgi:putative redox protein